MKFQDTSRFSGEAFDTRKPNYSADSLVATVAAVFTNPLYNVKTVSVEQENGIRSDFKRLPDTRTVYEIRVHVPPTFRVMTDWIEVSKSEYDAVLDRATFSCRKREVPA